jgi:hypothetical protein
MPENGCISVLYVKYIHSFVFIGFTIPILFYNFTIRTSQELHTTKQTIYGNKILYSEDVYFNG